MPGVMPGVMPGGSGGNGGNGFHGASELDHLEMRPKSYPTCDLGILIRGTTLSIGIPYETND